VTVSKFGAEALAGTVGVTLALEVIGHTVVVTAMTEVRIDVPSAVQLVTPGPQLVTVTYEVV
jgi:hypothetical protein